MTARVILAAALITIGVLGWVFWPRIAEWLTPTPEVEERAEPVEHHGATEAYGKELRAAGAMLPSSDLIRPAEQMAADREELHGISEALDHFGDVMTDALSRFLRNQPTVLLRLPSSIEQTGEFPVVELGVKG